MIYLPFYFCIYLLYVTLLISAQNGSWVWEIWLILWSISLCFPINLCSQYFVFSVLVLDVEAFERLLGPCMQLMKRNISDYEEQMVKIFGSKQNMKDIRWMPAAARRHRPHQCWLCPPPSRRRREGRGGAATFVLLVICTYKSILNLCDRLCVFVVCGTGVSQSAPARLPDSPTFRRRPSSRPRTLILQRVSISCITHQINEVLSPYLTLT